MPDVQIRRASIKYQIICSELETLTGYVFAEDEEQAAEVGREFYGLSDEAEIAVARINEFSGSCHTFRDIQPKVVEAIR